MQVNYSYIPSAASYAWIVRDNETKQQIRGSVLRRLDGGYQYLRGAWNGHTQVFEGVGADTLEELDPMIKEFIECQK
jgi:hypothetical protein